SLRTRPLGAFRSRGFFPSEADDGMSTRDSVQIPDDRDFELFRTECNSEQGWSLTYNKSGVVVWVQILEAEKSLHKIKVRGRGCQRAESVPTSPLHTKDFRSLFTTSFHPLSSFATFYPVSPKIRQISILYFIAILFLNYCFKFPFICQFMLLLGLSLCKLP
uniref:START domain-containing protein n=1 Tax=Anolis carolinensis TaxID=28377 RepID=A0A803SYS8_ANOCA